MHAPWSENAEADADADTDTKIVAIAVAILARLSSSASPTVPSPSPNPSAHRPPLPKASFRPGPRGYPVPVTQVLSKFSKRLLLTPGGLSCSSWPATQIHILVSPGTLC